jgi:outer membrane protein TolC
VALAEENLRLSQRMMEEDLGTIRDVLDAQASLTRVEGGRLSALVDLYLASVNLKHSMGEDLAAEMLK